MVIDDIDLPDPGPTQVLVRQFATGVCHSQLHELDRPNPTLPLVLGHESTGIVVGRRQGRAARQGRRPRHGDLGAPHPRRPRANRREGRLQRCRGQIRRAGQRRHLHLGPDVVVDEQMVVPLDKNADVNATAPVGCAVMTGVGAAINAAQVRPGDSVAVIGVGGVGLSVVAGAAIAGAYPIIAVDLTDEKIEFAKQFGATHGVNASKGDAGGAGSRDDGRRHGRWRRPRLRRDRRQDHDGAVPYRWRVPAAPANAKAARASSSACHTASPPTPAMFMLFGGKVYRGAPGGCSNPNRDFPMMIRWFLEGRLPLDKMVTKDYTLEQINEACDDLRAGKIAGRSIVKF